MQHIPRSRGSGGCIAAAAGMSPPRACLPAGAVTLATPAGTNAGAAARRALAAGAGTNAGAGARRGVPAWAAEVEN